MRKKNEQMTFFDDKCFWIIIAIILALSLINLGDKPFWGDETVFMHYARTITNDGIPNIDSTMMHSLYSIDKIVLVENSSHTQGIELAIKSSDGKYIYTQHPWIMSYIAATTMFIFGESNEFLSRLPFVIIGLLALPITYSLAMRLTQKRRIALISTSLLGFSVVFLLAIRSINYYSILLFATPAIILSYLNLLKGKKNAYWQLGLSSAILFHSQWLVFVFMMSAIGLHFLFYNIIFSQITHSIYENKHIYKNKQKYSYYSHNSKNKGIIKNFILSIIIIGLLTMPWFILTQQYNKGTVLSSPLQYLLLLGIGIYHISSWFIPIIFIPIILSIAIIRYKYRGNYRNRNIPLNLMYDDSKHYMLLLLPIICALLILPINSFSGTPIRYFYGILPLAMIINAYIIDFFYEKSKLTSIIIILLMILTNILYIAPILPMKNSITAIAESYEVLDTENSKEKNFFEKSIMVRSLFSEYIYEITHHVKTPTEEMLILFNVNSNNNPHQVSNQSIFFGDGDSNAIAYYTGMMTAVQDESFDNYDYDWIILSHEDPRNNLLSDTKEYICLEINLRIGPWDHTADPVHHVFATPYDKGFYVYKNIKNQ
ncbi:MAG: ArnT family glycosyltransferase [Candidatus Woesearchaeota archaeon]